jgi:ribose/xylose/arabinose/galactoside ABC-type transport system permease subunit
MFESVVASIKTLPAWLATVAEILLVATVFLAAVTFLAGIWAGICIVRKRANYISSFSIIPFKIEFKPKQD